VAVGGVHGLSQRLIDRYEAVTGVNELGVLETVRAVIPVWAIQALVADTVNELVAAIADSVVTNIPAGIAQEIRQSRKHSLGCGRLEGMARMVTMLIANMASQAKVVIITRDAGDELLLGEHGDTAVTGASGLLFVGNRLLLIGESSRNILLLGLLGLDFGCDALGSAVDDTAILDEALDHPVSASGAVNTVVDTSRAKVVIATIAYAAMEVLVLHGLVAVVAIDNPRGAYIARLGAERKTRVIVGSCKVVEEVCYGC
jgi:hypothetical protein